MCAPLFSIRRKRIDVVVCLLFSQYSSEEEEEDLNSAAANLANKQKKDLAKVDHAGVDYEPFRKAFYVEVPEIARMAPEEVKKYKEVIYSYLLSALLSDTLVLWRIQKFLINNRGKVFFKI